MKSPWKYHKKLSFVCKMFTLLEKVAPSLFSVISQLDTFHVTEKYFNNINHIFLKNMILFPKSFIASATSPPLCCSAFLLPLF